MGRGISSTQRALWMLLSNLPQKMAWCSNLLQRVKRTSISSFKQTPNFLITSVRIIKGSVEYYSRGQFVTETTSIDISTPTRLLTITADQLSYGSGTITHVENGCSADNTIPRNYTGTAYYSVPDPEKQGLSFLTIAISTEMMNSGSFVLEETSTGTLLEPDYTIKVAGSEWTGTATYVNEMFARASQQGQIKHGDHVEVLYDVSKVGFILVQKGDSGYEEPKEPDWYEKPGSISFNIDTENRAMRIMYNSSPGSVKLVHGQNPLGLSTQVEISHLKNPIDKEYEYFTGTVEQVNEKIAEWIYTCAVWNDDQINFRLITPEHVDTVSMASKKVNYGREESMSPFSGNVLQQSTWSVTLSNLSAYEFRLNYHILPGKVYIDETAPNQGIFGFTAKSGPITIVQKDDTASKACAEMNADIERKAILLGATITVTFPDNISSVRMGVGTQPSQDITSKLDKDRKFTYTETVDDVQFYVVYKNAGGEIIINPSLPIDPDVPPFDPSIFGGGNTGTEWTNPPVTGTGCTCPTCTWMDSMYPGFSSGMLIKPEWSVQLSTAPAGDYEAVPDTTVLAADEVYTFTADMEIQITITPVTNYPVNVNLSYTVDGKSYDFSVSKATGEITATVIGEVSIDVEVGDTELTAQMPKGYAVHMPKPDEGTALRDHNMAAPGDTVTIAVLPDRGKTVDEVQVLNSSGVSIPVQYLGYSDKNYLIYTFTMPEDAVFIYVTYTPTGA